METTILLNIATLKVFPLADMKGRSFFIINIVLVDTCTLLSMPEHDWKYHFHLVLGASCMVWLSNSSTHWKVQYDSTPRLSKDIYSKYTGFMQSLLWKKCWTYGGQLHAWVAFLINVMYLGMDHGKRCKDLYWYLHRSINSLSAYIVRGSFYMYMETNTYTVNKIIRHINNWI